MINVKIICCEMPFPKTSTSNHKAKECGVYSKC